MDTKYLNNKGSGALYVVLAAVVIVLVIVGYMMVTSDTTEELTTTPTTTENGTTFEENGSDIDEEELTDPDNALVGAYTGTYIVNQNELELPVSFTISRDMIIRGTGELANGDIFTATGTVNTDGTFEASGSVEGAGSTVTFTGTFSSENQTVIGNGEWEAGSWLNGTWSATKN
jgi:hypothetical protein